MLRMLLIIVSTTVLASCAMTEKDSPAVVFTDRAGLFILAVSAKGAGDGAAKTAFTRISAVDARAVVAEQAPKTPDDVLAMIADDAAIYRVTSETGADSVYILDRSGADAIVDLTLLNGGFDPTVGQVFSGVMSDGGGVNCTGCATRGGNGCPPCGSVPPDPPKFDGRRIADFFAPVIGERFDALVPLMTPEELKSAQSGENCPVRV